MKNSKINRERSDQGGDEHDERHESCDVGLVEHGADDGALFVEVGNGVGGSLADEGEQHNDQDDEFVHFNSQYKPNPTSFDLFEFITFVRC